MTTNRKHYDRLVAYAEVCQQGMGMPDDGFAQVVVPTQDLVLGMKYAQEQLLGTGTKSSAEQLAIAMMTKARSLFQIGERDAMVFPSDLQNVADRLAQWASDVRQLGVQHFSVMADMAAAVSTRDRAEAKLARIQEFVDMWQSAAEGMNTSDLRMGDIAEVLHD